MDQAIAGFPPSIFHFERHTSVRHNISLENFCAYPKPLLMSPSVSDHEYPHLALCHLADAPTYCIVFKPPEASIN
jgi:hypothetical protein